MENESILTTMKYANLRFIRSDRFGSNLASKSGHCAIKSAQEKNLVWDEIMRHKILFSLLTEQHANSSLVLNGVDVSSHRNHRFSLHKSHHIPLTTILHSEVHYFHMQQRHAGFGRPPV